MNCQDVQPFLSALYDGETVPKEAAEHIGSCPTCRERLRDYAQMGAELRLLASSSAEEAPRPLRALPPQGRRWAHSLTARVLVPRFALGLGVVAIVGLSLGLGIMRAQVTGLYFQFNVTSPERKASWGNEVQAGYRGRAAFAMTAPDSKVGAMVDVLEIQYGLVRLAVRTRRFEIPSAGQEANRARKTTVASMSDQERGKMVANSTPHEYQYVPGQTLEIPVEGGGTLLLTGRVLERRASIWLSKYDQLEPKPDEIVLNEPVLIRDKGLLIEKVGSASARGGSPYVAVYAPDEGLFAFLPKPFEGAVEAEVEYGQARFKLDGHEYVLLSMTPITGGEQPRQIWVYHDPSYRPSGPGAFDSIASGSNFASFLADLRK